MRNSVSVIGGGLAGCEAAWQLARRGVPVRLYEMKPVRFSAAHTSESLAELVCSNSFRSDVPTSAIGLLHEEMRRLDSLILSAADACRVPAGKALAVDRVQFSREVTEAIRAQPQIEVVHEEVTELPEGLAILATGPLTSDALAATIGRVCGDSLYFYDSISPTVYADSLDHDVVFRASRYEDGEGDYLNIPLSRRQYYDFVDELLRAEKVPLHRFEKAIYFEACLPIEVMAERGRDTLAFGPMKPVGLRDPRGGVPPFAIVQLRQEDKTGTLCNFVGFQTKMRIGEQRRIFRSLPGMEGAVFARYGSAHRNTFVRAPSLLDDQLQHRERDGLYFAGQIAGVEGYVESTALGLLAGIFAAARVLGKAAAVPPPTTALGALLRHLREANPESFQPMNVNYGLFPAIPAQAGRPPKRERNLRMSTRALADLAPWAKAVGAAVS
jgi:methylenetetrahydrofolate--tRNA-(uracil-5-)-methyltransferase